MLVAALAAFALFAALQTLLIFTLADRLTGQAVVRQDGRDVVRDASGRRAQLA